MNITRRAVVAAAAVSGFAVARRASAADPLVIGVVTPLTGAVADPGASR